MSNEPCVYILIEKPKDGALGTTSTATTTSAQISVPPPSMLRGKTLEEIVNKWTSELETHVKEFGKYAGEVAVWDRTLVESGNNVGICMSKWGEIH